MADARDEAADAREEVLVLEAAGGADRAGADGLPLAIVEDVGEQAERGDAQPDEPAVAGVTAGALGVLDRPLAVAAPHADVGEAALALAGREERRVAGRDALVE